MAACPQTINLQECQKELGAVLQEARGIQLQTEVVESLDLAPTVQYTTSTFAQSLRVLNSELKARTPGSATGNTALLCLGQVVVVVGRRLYLLIFHPGSAAVHLAALCKESLSAIGASISMEALWHGVQWILSKVPTAVTGPAASTMAKYLATGGFAVLVLRAITILTGQRRFMTIDEALNEFLSGVAATLPAAVCVVLPIAGPPAFAIGMVLTAGIWGVQYWMTSLPKDKTTKYSKRVPAPMQTMRSVPFWLAFWSTLRGRQPVPMEWNISIGREMELALEETCPDLLCPISRAIIVDPVILNGKLYERSFVQDLVVAKGKDAFGSGCTLAQLRPCPRAANVIRVWAASEGLTLRPRRF